MKVKIKKLHPDAVIPSYAKPGDAGMDLTAISKRVETGSDENGEYIEYGTGLAIEIPEGHVGLVFPRSSVSKKDLFLANAVGVIDSGYRGEVKLRYKVEQEYDVLVDWEHPTRMMSDTINYQVGDRTFYANIYAVGDKVGQLIILPYPTVEMVEVDHLGNSDRGEGGFGSTGK
jgi:dUTP pyrophosphatase